MLRTDQIVGLRNDEASAEEARVVTQAGHHRDKSHHRSLLDIK